ncbi:MAG: hypothetical protein IT449_15570 [Phycisphaerales bacterium]|nr:hypothetical protein [Phycisphaerales bacterium]
MRNHCRACSVVLAVWGGAIGGISCRDEAPPMTFPENLGDEGRLLGPLPTASYALPEKLATGRAELKPLDFDRTSGAADPDAAGGGVKGDDAAAKDGGAAAKDGGGAPTAGGDGGAAGSEEGGTTADAGGAASGPAEFPPLPTPTTAEFPETTQAVGELITAYNAAAAGGDIDELVAFYVEDQRPDMAAALKLSLKAVDRVESLIAGLEKAKPGASAAIKAMLPGQGRRDQMFMMHVATLTPKSETQAVGKLGAMYGGEEIRFRKMDEAWQIDPNAAKILAEAQRAEKTLGGLDEVIEGLNKGTMDLPTAQQKMMQWMAKMGGGQAAPQPGAPGAVEPKAGEAKPEGGAAQPKP